VTGASLVRDNVGDLLEQSTLAIAVAAVALIFAVRQTGLLWYRLGAVEPVAYALAVAAALAVALVASLPSAYRAAAVDPLDAIRAE